MLFTRYQHFIEAPISYIGGWLFFYFAFFIGEHENIYQVPGLWASNLSTAAAFIVVRWWYVSRGEKQMVRARMVVNVKRSLLCSTSEAVDAFYTFRCNAESSRKCGDAIQYSLISHSAAQCSECWDAHLRKFRAMSYDKRQSEN